MRGRGCGRHRGRGEGPFRKGGFRRTAPRQAVLEILREADDFLSADEVYIKVIDRLPGIGIATVYRTLQLLTELGELARVSGDDGKARYRFSTEGPAPRRVVLVCRSCARTQAAPVAGEIERSLAALEAGLRAEHGFAAERSVHQLYGLCEACAANE
ncbi:MAG: Fur family transcriptional regulator [Spirochaetota bacterium]